MNKTGSEIIGRLPAPKYWPQQVHICEEKHLAKAAIQALTNPDYKVAHPAECRNNPEGKLSQCHPEAKVRILKELAAKIKNVNRPLSVRTPRYNRS